MKWLYFFILFSHCLQAQDLCGPKVKKVDCQKSIKQAIFFKEYETVKKIINKHGIHILFENDRAGGPYGHISSAAFFNNTTFFKILASHKEYPGEIPDKNQFLNAVFDDIHFREKDPEIAKLIFNHSDKTKQFEWWENPEWPYPLFDRFKLDISKRKDKAKYQSLIDTFDEIEGIKKNICQIDSVDDLKKTTTKFRGLAGALKNPSIDLLSCAVSSGNNELALYLIENDLFSPLNLGKQVTHLNSGTVNISNLTLLSSLEKKMEQLKVTHPDKRTKQTLWTLEHFDQEIECIQNGPNNELTGLKTFAELTQKIVFSGFIKEAEKLKEATLSKNEVNKNKSIENIIELIIKSGMPLNYLDSDGKSIMHHLAAFADFSTIEKIEKSLNDYKGSMKYSIQDNQGNTPLHIALINKNLSGSLALADRITQMKSGFGYGSRNDVNLKNSAGKTPLDLVKEIEVAKADKATLKTIKRWIQEHINPKGRFDIDDDDY